MVGLEPNSAGEIKTVVTRDVETGATMEHETDAVVFAIGITGRWLVTSRSCCCLIVLAMLQL